MSDKALVQLRLPPAALPAELRSECVDANLRAGPRLSARCRLQGRLRLALPHPRLRTRSVVPPDRIRIALIKE